MKYLERVISAFTNIISLTRREGIKGRVSKRRTFRLPHHLSTFYDRILPVEVITKMRQDGQVQAGLSAIKLPILASEFTIRGDEERFVEFVKENINRLYHKLLKALLNSLDYGFSVCELVYEERKGLLYMSDVVELHPEGLSFVLNDYGEITEVKLPGNILIPREKCLVFTLNGEFGNPYGSSRLLSAYQFWRTKEIIYLYANRYYERKGNPPTIVRYPGDKQYYSENEDALNTAVEIGSKLLENSVVVLPHITDSFGNDAWSLEYLIDDARGRMFIDYIEHLNKMILRSMIVPERVISQDQSVGSYSMAKTHLDIFLLSEDGLISELSDCITEQFIKPLIELNFPSQHSDLSLVIERLSQQNKEFLSEILIEMIRDDRVILNPEKIAASLGIEIN